VGIANDRSIAWGCARAFRENGAELAITYLNAKAEPYVRPLAESVNAPIILPLDLQDDDALKTVFNSIEAQWGKLDFLLHAVAFAQAADLNGRVVDCSREGFAEAMDISCHSFLRMAKHAEPLMKDGGAMMTLSYHGGEKVVEGYNVMGPVKAALESAVRYMAVELGPKRITVNALSAGLVATRAARGLSQFDAMYAKAEASKPLPAPLTIEDVGNMAAFLASDKAKAITGAVHFVDGGYHITD
ncbi:MAG: enoyl-ACP reductase FabI, partial [Rickettsiales bacterium]